MIFEDEASFWLDGTLHRTWSRIGVQPRIDTYGFRKTAHVHGAVALHDASFTYELAEVFNGKTFHHFLKRLVARYPRRKIFLIIDNGPCHWLDEEGKPGTVDERDAALVQTFKLFQRRPHLIAGHVQRYR